MIVLLFKDEDVAKRAWGFGKRVEDVAQFKKIRRWKAFIRGEGINIDQYYRFFLRFNRSAGS